VGSHAAIKTKFKNEKKNDQNVLGDVFPPEDIQPLKRKIRKQNQS